MIVLVMDGENYENSDSIFTKWMPLVQRMAPKVSSTLFD